MASLLMFHWLLYAKGILKPFSSRSDIQQDLELKRGEGDQTDLLNSEATANLFVGLRNVLGETDLLMNCLLTVSN